MKIKLFAALPAIFILYFLFLSHACLADELPRYDITASIDTESHKITAIQKVIFTNNSGKPLNEINFHIYPHRKYTPREIRFMYRFAGYFKVNPFPEGFQSGDLKINSIESSGRPLAYKIEGDDQTILKVNLDSPLEPGQFREIKLDFILEIPHCWNRLGWHNDIITLTRWYPILSVLNGAGWNNHSFYIYHQPFFSDAAYYKLNLTLAKKEKVVCGAFLKDEILNSDGTKTLVLENESPMRDLGLAVSANFKLYSLALDKIKVNVFYLDGNLKPAQKMAGYAADAMKFYAARFGEYPYKEFSIAPSFLGFGGDQSSGMIFIDERMFRLPGFLSRYSDFLVSHETGHQWFYNIVGSDEYKEMFLDEGVNSYWLLRHLENKYGYNAQVMALPKTLQWLVPNFSFRDSTASRYIYLAKNGYDRPVIGELSSFKEPSSIFALAYGKGAAVLNMLEAQAGEEIFERIFARYTREFRFKNAGLTDFIRICREESGQNLDEFFTQWLKTDKKCDFAVNSVRPGKVVLENKGTLRMPVNTRIKFKDGSEITDQWQGLEKKHEINFGPEKSVEEVSVDPDKMIDLDFNRVNNHWPRKLKLKTVPFYFFPWEMPLFQDRDAYNVVSGPSFGGASLGASVSAQKPYDNILRFSTVYDFNGKAVDSKLGYELCHVFNRHNNFGVEIFNYESSRENNDLNGGKIYWRRELWPVSYGIFDINDHVVLYLLKDRKLGSTSTLNGGEPSANLKYARKDEAIVGITGSMSRCGPYSDPDYGWKFIPTQEFAGHFWGGNQSFWRSSAELENYYLFLPRYQQKIATRVKAGTGGSEDKNLFQLGGWEGLRGYGLKTIDGSRMIMASIEHRFPLRDGMKIYFFDDIFRLNKIQGVLFFDAGRAWHSDFSRSKFKKDAGLGLRFHFGVAGILEKIVLRVDAARAISEPKESTRFWLGINQFF